MGVRTIVSTVSPGSSSSFVFFSQARRFTPRYQNSLFDFSHAQLLSVDAILVPSIPPIQLFFLFLFSCSLLGLLRFSTSPALRGDDLEISASSFNLPPLGSAETTEVGHPSPSHTYLFTQAVSPPPLAFRFSAVFRLPINILAPTCLLFILRTR